MKIDRLPLPLLIFATVLYLVAIGGFGVLAKNYRMTVPQASSVTLLKEDKASATSTQRILRVEEELPTGLEELTFKYFHQGVPQYIHLEGASLQPGAGKLYQVQLTGEVPSTVTDTLEGFIHFLKPIEQPLLSFLLE